MERLRLQPDHEIADANDSSNNVRMKSKIEGTNNPEGRESHQTQHHDCHPQHHNHHQRSLYTSLRGLHLVLIVLMTGLVTRVDSALANTIESQPTTIKIACLLPAKNSYLFSIQRVRPAIELAFEKVTNQTGLLPGRKIVIEYADTRCASSYAMHLAIEYYINQKPHAYLGPVCDYGAAPLGRQAPYWNIPMISQPMARPFAQDKKTEFSLLTRVGSSVNKMNEMLQVVFTKFNWTQVKIIYEPHGRDDIMVRYCHICVDGMHAGLSLLMGTVIPYFKFDTLDEILDNMEEEIGLKHSVIIWRDYCEMYAARVPGKPRTLYIAFLRNK